MATYSTNPRKFKNGAAYGTAKEKEEAEQTKRRARVHVLRDTWRERFPRKIDDTKGREDSSGIPQQQDAPQP